MCGSGFPSTIQLIRVFIPLSDQLAGGMILAQEEVVGEEGGSCAASLV